MNYIYRMTHIDNIPHILKHGITHRESADADPSYIPIGDTSIIDKRRNLIRETVAGEKISLGDFIPFYFYARMPMLYNIQHGYKVERVDAENIVYLIVAIKAITNDSNRKFYFSDGHTVSRQTKFYGKDRLGDIDRLADIEWVKSNDWGNDYVVKERKQAEFLIMGDIPTSAIATICCYSSNARQRLVDMGVSCDIIVRPKAYY